MNMATFIILMRKMNIIERNKSFTIESFKERSAALANFLAENPPLTYCIIIRMDSSNKINYRAMFLDKKYWIAVFKTVFFSNLYHSLHLVKRAKHNHGRSLAFFFWLFF